MVISQQNKKVKDNDLKVALIVVKLTMHRIRWLVLIVNMT